MSTYPVYSGSPEVGSNEMLTTATDITSEHLYITLIYFIYVRDLRDFSEMWPFETLDHNQGWHSSESHRFVFGVSEKVGFSAAFNSISVIPEWGCSYWEKKPRRMRLWLCNPRQPHGTDTPWSARRATIGCSLVCLAAGVRDSTNTCFFILPFFKSYHNPRKDSIQLSIYYINAFIFSLMMLHDEYNTVYSRISIRFIQIDKLKHTALLKLQLRYERIQALASSQSTPICILFKFEISK